MARTDGLLHLFGRHSFPRSALEAMMSTSTDGRVRREIPVNHGVAVLLEVERPLGRPVGKQRSGDAATCIDRVPCQSGMWRSYRGCRRCDAWKAGAVLPPAALTADPLLCLATAPADVDVVAWQPSCSERDQRRLARNPHPFGCPLPQRRRHLSPARAPCCPRRHTKSSRVT